jgi:hypothetical protein
VQQVLALIDTHLYSLRFDQFVDVLLSYRRVSDIQVGPRTITGVDGAKNVDRAIAPDKSSLSGVLCQVVQEIVGIAFQLGSCEPSRTLRHDRREVVSEQA